MRLLTHSRKISYIFIYERYYEHIHKYRSCARVRSTHSLHGIRWVAFGQHLADDL